MSHFMKLNFDCNASRSRYAELMNCVYAKGSVEITNIGSYACHELGDAFARLNGQVGMLVWYGVTGFMFDFTFCSRAIRTFGPSVSSFDSGDVQLLHDWVDGSFDARGGCEALSVAKFRGVYPKFADLLALVLKVGATMDHFKFLPLKSKGVIYVCGVAKGRQPSRLNGKALAIRATGFDNGYVSHVFDLDLGFNATDRFGEDEAVELCQFSDEWRKLPDHSKTARTFGALMVQHIFPEPKNGVTDDSVTKPVATFGCCDAPCYGLH